MRDRTSIIISALGHAGVIAWTIVSFHARPLDAKPVETIPIDIVTDKELAQLTAGTKTGKQDVPPKPIVEKVADTAKPVEDIKPKVSEKKEVQPTAEPTTPPPQPPKLEKPQEAKPKEVKPQPDPIAEALKKDEAKKPETKPVEKKAEVKPPMPPKKQPERPYDANQIAALLDKRDPQRQAATGAVQNTQQSLGAAKGTASRLSQNEIAAFVRRVQSCWNVPVGASDAQNLWVDFRVIFRPDGAIMQGPDVVEASASSFGPAFAESGRRALLQCQPYTMFKPETYDQWKDLTIHFDLKEMFRS